MAAVEEPTLAKNGFDDSEKHHSQGSFSDEKGPQIAEINLDDAEEVGEVFADGPRLIDLGVDGNERPIGAFHLPHRSLHPLTSHFRHGR